MYQHSGSPARICALSGVIIATTLFLQQATLTSAADREAIDLLAKIDPARDTIQGEWKREGQTLVSFRDPRPWSVLTIPYAPPEQYTLTAAVQRRDGTRHFGIGLVVGSRNCVVLVGEDGVGGINFIDGQGFKRNGTMAEGQPLDQGKTYTIDCDVRKAGQDNVKVVVRVDGKQIIDWTGAASHLGLDAQSPHPVAKAGKEHFVWVQSFASSFAVSKLELRPLAVARPDAVLSQPKQRPNVSATAKSALPKPTTTAETLTKSKENDVPPPKEDAKAAATLQPPSAEKAVAKSDSGTPSQEMPLAGGVNKLIIGAVGLLGLLVGVLALWKSLRPAQKETAPDPDEPPPIPPE